MKNYELSTPTENKNKKDLQAENRTRRALPLIKLGCA